MDNDTQVTLDMSKSTPLPSGGGVTLDMSKSKPLAVSGSVKLDLSKSTPLASSPDQQQEDERYNLTHPEAGHLPEGATKPTIDVDPGHLTIPVEERLQHFKKSYDEDPGGAPLKHAGKVVKEQGEGLLKDAAQISAPGILTSVLNKKAPSVASKLPKIMTDNATPVEQLPKQLVENYVLGGGVEGGLPGEDEVVERGTQSAPPLESETTEQSSAKSGASLGDIAKEYGKIKLGKIRTKLLDKIPFSDVRKAISTVNEKMQPIDPSEDVVGPPTESAIRPYQGETGPREDWGKRITSQPDQERFWSLGKIATDTEVNPSPTIKEQIDAGVPLGRLQNFLQNFPKGEPISDPKRSALGRIPIRDEGDLRTPLDFEPDVKKRVSELSNDDLKSLGQSFGIDPEKYDFKRREALREGGSKHPVERNRFVDDLMQRMPDSWKAKFGKASDDLRINQQKFPDKDLASRSRADQSREVFRDRLGIPQASMDTARMGNEDLVNHGFTQKDIDAGRHLPRVSGASKISAIKDEVNHAAREFLQTGQLEDMPNLVGQFESGTVPLKRKKSALGKIILAP